MSMTQWHFPYLEGCKDLLIKFKVIARVWIPFRIERLTFRWAVHMFI